MKLGRRNLALLACAGFAAAALALGPLAGGNGGNAELETLILWQVRLPRVAAAFLAGAALALCGMTFQAVFRNALATPFTLGTSAGAAFGASLALYAAPGAALLGIPLPSTLAFAGAMAAMLIVYGLARVREGTSAEAMLLGGVAINFFFSSLILLVQYLSDFNHSFRILRWMMGGVDVAGPEPVLRLLPLVAAGCGVILLHLREINLLSLGGEIAAGRGVDVTRTQVALFFAVSLAVGGVVAVCGPIGFVGMMAPHICRLCVGPDHRYLAPAAALFGGAFLVACDTVARTVIAPAEIPVGVITAFLGGPFFLWLLARRKDISLS